MASDAYTHHVGCMHGLLILPFEFVWPGRHLLLELIFFTSLHCHGAVKGIGSKLFSPLFSCCMRTRQFLNVDEIVRSAEKLGFKVVVSEGTHEVASFAEIANSCDTIMGVHSVGLTNMVFLSPGGVVIQIVPRVGLEFVAS
jgi:hypothetical protein